jgi:hypothetical protein
LEQSTREPSGRLGSQNTMQHRPKRIFELAGKELFNQATVLFRPASDEYQRFVEPILRHLGQNVFRHFDIQTNQ